MAMTAAILVPMPNSRGLLALIAAVLLFLGAPAAALADADLVESTPKADSTVTQLTQVILTFNQALNADRSSVVLRTGGQTVAEGGVDLEDPSRMVVYIDAAVPGDYEVRYTANSEDGHLVRDTFGFRFEPAASSVVPATTSAATGGTTPSPTAATPQASASATTQPAPVPAPSAGAGDVLVPIVAALGLLGVAGAYLLRRRAP